MSFAEQGWGIRGLLLVVSVMLCLSAERAQAQGRVQNRQHADCPQNTGQAQLKSRQPQTSLRNALQTQLRQLNTLQQTASLTSAQQQVVSQLQIALQNALQQLAADATNNLAAAPGQTVLAPQFRAVPSLGGR
jgi:hypothetical protein